MPVQILHDGLRNVVVKITDDVPGTDAGIAVDVSTLNPPCTRVNINRVWFTLLDSERALLEWDDPVNPELIMALHGQQDFNFEFFGGLTNNAPGPGVSGDILYFLPENGGTVIIHCTKHGVISASNN